MKGAFTGAIKDRIGRFQLADHGTLFLDEIGEIPLELQPKLLRALQEGELERVGDDKTLRVDVRVIAATNRDLLADVHAGRFREDLYYRLDVFPIVLPPLRERIEDIPLLAAHFAERARISVGRPKFRLSDADLRTLCGYGWPGNIRELANVIERAAILSPDGRHVDVASLLTTSEPTPPPHVLTEAAWRELEKQNLLAALEQTNGKLHGPGGRAPRDEADDAALAAARARHPSHRLRHFAHPDPAGTAGAILLGMKLRMMLISAILGTGCYVQDQPRYMAAGPGYGPGPGPGPGPGVAQEAGDGGGADLVEVSPGVEVVADYNEPIFYADDYYWVNRGGIWYSSTWYGGGWGRAGYISPRLGGIAHPEYYAHYRPNGYVRGGGYRGGGARAYNGGGGVHVRAAPRASHHR